MKSSCLLLPAVLSVLVWVSACGVRHPDYAIPLGHGYELVHGNEHEVVISDSKHVVVVPGKIVEYAVIGDVVAGHVKRPDWSDEAGKAMFADVVEGYFMLDTATNTCSLGMTLAGLTDALRARGIGNPPSFEAPHRP